MGNELNTLVANLEAQRNEAKDYVVDSRELTAVPLAQHLQGTTDLLGQVVDATVAAKAHQGLGIQVSGLGTFAPTNLAHDQIASKCGIPSGYYNRMIREGRWPLLAENINAWMPDRERRLVRTLGPRMRALLSDGYRILDNLDLLWASLEAFKGLDLQIQGAEASETRLYLRATARWDKNLLKEIKPGDMVAPGVTIRNSEVGNGKLAVEPFLLRLVCSNGMIGEHSFSRVHIGAKNPLGHLSYQTIADQSKAIWGEIGDTIRATFNPKFFDEWVERIQGTAGVKIKAPERAIDNVVKEFSLPDAYKHSLLAHFANGGDGAGATGWGVINAVTRQANMVAKDHPDMAYDLQKAAGAMTTMKLGDFEVLVAA